MPQGICLQSEDGEGARYMRNFDEFPPAVRRRIAASPYNLCAACLCDIAHYQFRWDYNPELMAIEYMESRIRSA